MERYKTGAFGNQSTKTLGPQVWNTLPEKIKLVKNLLDFKNSRKKLLAPKCMCNLFSFKKANAENGYESSSLHTPLTNSFLSNFISV